MTERPQIVADLGGTNTRVAQAAGGQVVAGSLRRYANRDFDGLEAVLARYLDEVGLTAPSGLCVAAAGLVRDGATALTNLDWVVRTDRLAEATGVAAPILINDLQAQGHALPALPANALRRLFPAPRGSDDPEASRLVIGIGTGFNAVAVHDGGAVVPAGEAGHVSLPVADLDDLALARQLAAGSDGFASVEDALSGRGLGALDARVAGPLAAPRDAAAVMDALARGEERANRAVALFARLLGRVAGDLALIHLPYGGIYLAGGVARAVGPHLATGGFAEAFAAKGRMRGFMDQFPVWLIEDDFAALTGCAVRLAAQGRG